MLREYTIERVNLFALILSWASTFLISISLYFNRRDPIDSLICLLIGLTYLIPSIIYRFNPRSREIKFWVVGITVIYSQAMMLIQKGLFDNTYFLCISIVGTAIYFNVRLTMVTTAYIMGSSGIMYFFFKPQFFPIFNNDNFMSLELALFIIGSIVALQTVWSKQLVNTQAVLYERAVRDKLTNLYNRTFYDEEMLRAYHEHKSTGESLSIILIDIDDFKTINDTFGHSQGDLVLIEISNRIRTACRKTDVTARIGGEEFVIILERTTAKEARRVGKKILDTVNEKKVLNLMIGVSIGIAELQPGEEFQEFFDRADMALYRAKQTGKNKLELAPNIDVNVNKPE
jgi:diguanylate cyclase (GGDEF)-like protein